MPRIEFFFDRKMSPSMESQPSILLPMDCGERQKVRGLKFCSCTMSFSQVISDTMLDFYHLSNMILASYLREYHAQQLITRDNRHIYFPRGNHKGENPATSSKIE